MTNKGKHHQNKGRNQPSSLDYTADHKKKLGQISFLQMKAKHAKLKFLTSGCTLGIYLRNIQKISVMFKHKSRKVFTKGSPNIDYLKIVLMQGKTESSDETNYEYRISFTQDNTTRYEYEIFLP